MANNDEILANAKAMFGDYESEENISFVYAIKNFEVGGGVNNNVNSYGEVGLGIDCSNLVQQSLLASGYNVRYLSTGQIFSDGQLTAAGGSFYEAVPLDQLQAGNLILFQGQIGIVQSFDPDSGAGVFYGSQTSTGPATTIFNVNGDGYWGGVKPVLPLQPPGGPTLKPRQSGVPGGLPNPPENPGLNAGAFYCSASRLKRRERKMKKGYMYLLFKYLLVGIFVITGCFAANAQKLAGENYNKIAGRPLNEYDLEGFCWGANHDGTGAGQSFFGFLRLQGSAVPSFVFVTSVARAEVDIFGYVNYCKKYQEIFTYSEENGFSFREIDKKEYASLRSELVEFSNSHEAIYPQDSGLTETVDSVAGCVLPIWWYKFDMKQFAFFALSSSGVFIETVVPPLQGEKTPAGISPCDAWGGHRMANTRISSFRISSMKIDAQKYFVYLPELFTGYIFKTSEDIKCVKSEDLINYYVAVEREFLFKKVFSDAVLLGLKKKYFTNISAVLSYGRSLELNAKLADIIRSICGKE